MEEEILERLGIIEEEYEEEYQDWLRNRCFGLAKTSISAILYIFGVRFILQTILPPNYLLIFLPVSLLIISLWWFHTADRYILAGFFEGSMFAVGIMMVIAGWHKLPGSILESAETWGIYWHVWFFAFIILFLIYAIFRGYFYRMWGDDQS